jgi:hypothetical protein
MNEEKLGRTEMLKFLSDRSAQKRKEERQNKEEEKG